jgi:hypothetical protein
LSPPPPLTSRALSWLPSAASGPAATCHSTAPRTQSVSHGPASSAWQCNPPRHRWRSALARAPRWRPQRKHPIAVPQRASSSAGLSLTAAHVSAVLGDRGGCRASHPPTLPRGGCMTQLEEEPRGSVRGVGEGQSSCKIKKQFGQVWSAHHAARPCSIGRRVHMYMQLGRRRRQGALGDTKRRHANEPRAWETRN